MSNPFEQPMTPEEQVFEDVENQEENDSTDEAVESESVFNTKPTKPETPLEQMARIKLEVMERVKNDPFIKEHLDAQSAIDASRGKPQPKESPFLYDEEGNYIGVKPEYKGKVSPYEQMKEIKRNTERKLKGAGQ